MNRIAEILLDWYAREGRDLPWRRTRDPYRIWLSEVILQQTRVAQGMEYYLRFTERFPDVASLAAAPEDEVLKLWQGLGYYSRVRNLRAAAREVVERFGGVFPRSLDDVRSLRGVGDYTAAAICSSLSEEIAKQAENLRAEAKRAGEKLIAAAQEQRAKLVEAAASKGALAKIAAEKGGDKLVQEAEKQAANLEAEAERQIEKLTSKKE